MEYIDSQKIGDKIYYNLNANDHIYPGVDLTQKFADEIKNYSDEWAWIKARIVAGNYEGIHVADYIPMTCSNGYVLNMQIAGINTYTGLGNSVIGNHIDFISKELWNTIHCFNKVDYNNGNDYTSSSFLASDLNYWLNSMSGSVPNSTTDYTEKVSVDYTSDGVLYYLPDKVKNQILGKRMLFPTRFSSSKILTKDNNYSWGNSKKLWIPSEIEVYGCPMWGDSNYGACGFIQYPLFSCNANRVKKRCVGKDAYAWWLLSTASNSSSQMCLVTGSGVCSCYNTTYNIPVPICFRIDDTGSLIT